MKSNQCSDFAMDLPSDAQKTFPCSVLMSLVATNLACFDNFAICCVVPPLLVSVHVFAHSCSMFVLRTLSNRKLTHGAH